MSDDSTPLTFKVAIKSGRPGGGGIRGSGELEVNESGLLLRSESKILLPPEGTMSVTWNDLREFRNRLRQKKLFLASFGNHDDMLMRVKLKDGSLESIEKLERIFDELPPEAFSLRCPKCSGPVIKNACRDCGTPFTAEMRKRGVQMLIGGVILAAVGIGLTSLSHDRSSGILTVYLGLIVSGLVLLVFGMIKAVFAVRTSF